MSLEITNTERELAIELANALHIEWSRATYHWAVTFFRANAEKLALLSANEDDAYEIGKRDGYEQAVQDIDLLTGGDGEYRWSSLPQRNCPDAVSMKAAIHERYLELESGAKAVTVVRDSFRDVLVRVARSAQRLLANYGEFGTVTDQEFFDDLGAALKEVPPWMQSVTASQRTKRKRENAVETTSKNGGNPPKQLNVKV